MLVGGDNVRSMEHVLPSSGDTLIILFTGGAKKRQQADIEWARTLLAEYKARKAAKLKGGK